MLNKVINKISNSGSLVELFRTYIVGAINLTIGLTLNYLLQFLLLVSISFPLRTYLTNTLAFGIGVVISYFLSRRIIFKLNLSGSTLKEFFNFISVNLISLFAPIAIWYIINLFNAALQKDEIWYLVVTVLIHGSILPIKYIVYKFFVFKDSL